MKFGQNLFPNRAFLPIHLPCHNAQITHKEFDQLPHSSGLPCLGIISRFEQPPDAILRRASVAGVRSLVPSKLAGEPAHLNIIGAAQTARTGSC
jgi:hypothetical protein